MLRARYARGWTPPRGAGWHRAVLHVTRNDRDVLVHPAGVDASYVYVLRSATMVAAVTAFMTLVRDGVVALEDPVARFIPAFVPHRQVEHMAAPTSFVRLQFALAKGGPSTHMGDLQPGPRGQDDWQLLADSAVSPQSALR